VLDGHRIPGTMDCWASGTWSDECHATGFYFVSGVQ